MAKQTQIEIPLLDAVTAIVACTEHRADAVKAVSPSYDHDAAKPSTNLFIRILDDNDEGIDREFPAITDYARVTLGCHTQHTHKKAVAATVTDEHRELAEKYINTITNKVTMMVLMGRPVNGFIASLAKALENTVVTSLELGLLTYVPKTAKQYLAAEEVDGKKAQFSQSKPLGAIGNKVFATVTVFNSREMSHYDSILYECNDDAGNLVTFFKNIASKAQFQVGETYKINGKIKAVGSTKFSFGAIVNTLNYVRLQK